MALETYWYCWYCSSLKSSSNNSSKLKSSLLASCKSSNLKSTVQLLHKIAQNLVSIKVKYFKKSTFSDKCSSNSYSGNFWRFSFEYVLLLNKTEKFFSLIGCAKSDKSYKTWKNILLRDCWGTAERLLSHCLATAEPLLSHYWATAERQLSDCCGTSEHR